MKKYAALAALAVIMLSLSGCFETVLFDYTIMGVVRQSGTGTPLEGVLVRVTVTGKAGSTEDLTDSSGAYSISLSNLTAPAQMNIYFSKAGFVSDSETINRSSDGTYTLNMLLVATQPGDDTVSGQATLMNLVPPASAVPSSVVMGRKVQKQPVVPETTEVIIHPKPGLRPDKMHSFLSAEGSIVTRTSFERGYILAKVPAGMDIEDFIEVIMAEGSAESVEPNDWAVVNGFFEPLDDYFFSAQWNMFATTMPYVWDMADFGSPFIIAVLDTGVDVDHPDLIGRTLTPIDTIYEASGTKDVYGHGTHVAGIIGCVVDNSQYMAGMNNRGAVILPVKVLGDGGGGTVASIADGIVAAADAGAKIISMSLGYKDGLSKPDIVTALEYAMAAPRNAIIVAAAGNEDEAQVDFPGNYPGVVTVSAVNHTMSSSNFTNYGPEVDFAAPGGTYPPLIGVWSLHPTDAVPAYVEEMAGTSQATPHVSALIAMLRQQGYSGSQALEMIGATAQDNHRSANYEYYYGRGIINAHAALNALTMDKAYFWLAEPTYPYNAVPGTLVNGDMDRSFSVPFTVEPGNYYLAGWMNTNGNTDVDDGDYYKAELISIPDGGFTYDGVFELDFFSTYELSSVNSVTVIPMESLPKVK